jgi:pimeloyl-ACP methyl ester carboxylesterase
MNQHKKFSGPDGDFHWIDWGGCGPLLHLSHATGFCAGVYTPLAERLLTHFRVIGMDDRGHGTTSAPADPTRLLDWNIFAEDLEGFFEHLSEPVIAVGHSRGAMSSLRVAISRPELVTALVLIDPIILPSRWNWFLFAVKKPVLPGSPR